MQFAKPIVDKRLYSASLMNMSIRYIKYLKRINLSLKPKDKNFFQCAKIRKSIKHCPEFAIHELSDKSLALFNLALLISSSFQKSVTSLIITLLPTHKLPYLGFKNVKELDFTMEGRGATSSTHLNRTVKRILTSPKLEKIELDPATWSHIDNLKRLKKVKEITMNSKLSRFLNEKSQGLFEKLKNVDFSFFLDVDKTQNFENLNSLKPCLTKCQNLFIKQAMVNNDSLLLLTEMIPHLRSLKHLRYHQDLSLTNSNLKPLSLITTLGTLKRLDLEFNLMEIPSADKFFDSLALPTGITSLRMNLSKCRKDVFSKLSFKEKFFQDLELLTQLKNIDFQIAKQLISALSSDYVCLFLVNLLTRVTKDLNHLKLTATGTGCGDHELLKKILEFEKLTFLSLDMVIKISNSSLQLIKDKNIKVKSLSIYDNMIMLQLPHPSLRSVEELCVYVSPDSLITNGTKTKSEDFSQLERGSYVLERILLMKNVRNISLYLFKKELFASSAQFIEGIKAILTGLKYLESIFVLVWSIEVSAKEAEMIEECFRHNKMINFVYIMVGVTTIGRDAKRCSYTSVL